MSTHTARSSDPAGKTPPAAPPTVIGNPPRLDGADKVTGRFSYGTDVTLPGMLWAKLRRSEIPHGLIRRIDASRARGLPGVRAVIVAADIGDFRASRYVRDEPMLAAERVRYHGEPIAAVAADSPAIAEEAVRLIEVEYEELPTISDPEAAMAPDAPLIHPDWQRYWAAPVLRRDGNVLNHATLERGDVAAAFARADHVFEDRYETHMVHQLSLEGRVAVADVGPDGDVHVLSSHQYPFGLRQDLSDILGIPLERIRVTATGLGGGFGGKLYAGVEPYCILLSQATGRPVKLAHTREEELIATSPRMAATVRVRTAVAADGRLLAREGRLVYDAGAYSESSPVVVSIGLLTLPGPYRWEALRIDSYAVYTNKANCGSYRGPGAPQAAFAGETQLDRIAAELGIDPLALRLRNAVEDGDLGPTGQVLTGVSLKETLQAAAERIGWDDRPATTGRGRGLACSWWTTTGGTASADLWLDHDGKVVLCVGATEIGTGAVQSGLARLCAAELGLSVDDLRLVASDTDSTPYDFGAQGSRTLFTSGNAVIQAAADLKQQLLAAAAGLLGCPADELEFAEGEVRSKDGPARLPLAELARVRGSERLTARASCQPPVTDYDETTLRGAAVTAFNSPSYSTHAAEVEVDPETGEVRLRRYVVAQDVGRALDPLYARGQLAGGAVQGIGYALFEHLQYRDGRVANPNLTDYKLPTIADLPSIETVLVEVPSEHGPYGAKGVGELSVIGPAAAIANAVADAAGVRVRALPLTGERVSDAMRGRG